MKETSARLLRLLALLQVRREWSGEELAERLGVSTRTIRRDVDKLRDLEYPVHASMGTSGGGYRLGAGAELPPLLLDDEEAVAVAISLRTATSSRIEGIGETALRALVKLQQVLPSRLRHRVEAMQISTVRTTSSAAPTLDADVLTAVATACRDRQRLRFDYRAHGAVDSVRDTEPHHLVSWGSRWYLVAWDVDRADWRTFRVDRIHPRIPTGPRFTPREIPGGDAAQFVARSTAGRWPVQATIRLHTAADSAAAEVWMSYSGIEPIDEHSCLLHIGADTMRDVVFMLSAVYVDFDVVAPPELADHLLEAADRFRRAAATRPD